MEIPKSRIIAQSGLFSIPKNIENNSAMKEIESKTRCVKIKIGESQRTELLSILDNMGYNQIKLFLDLDNLFKCILKRL